MATEDLAITGFFREIFDPCLDGCFLVHADGLIREANEVGLALLGVGRAELAGLRLQEAAASPAAEVNFYLDTCFRNRQQMPGRLFFPVPGAPAVAYRCRGHRVRLAEGPMIFLRCLVGAGQGNKFLALNQQLERQRQLHHQLKAERDLLESIAENAGAGLAVISRDYRTLWANSVIRGIWGDTIGKICYQTYCRRDNVCPWCGVREVFETGKQEVKTEATCFDRDGNLVYQEITATALHDDQGNITSVLELVVPITERKLAEKRLRDDERRAESLYHLSQLSWVSTEEVLARAVEEAVQLTDSDMGFIHLLSEDQSHSTLSAWSRGAAASCHMTGQEHFPLAGAGLWAEAVRQRRAMRYNDYANVKERTGLPEGHSPLQRFLSVPLVENGLVVAVLGVANKALPYDSADERQLTLFLGQLWTVMGRKRMEREVLTAKQQWETTFDAIDEVVTIHDAEMRVVRANRAAGLLLKADPASLTGMFCHQLFAKRDEPCPGCPELLARSSLSPHSANVQHFGALGKTFDVSSFPIVDNGVLQGFVHIAKDITAEKMLEAQLHQAQKMEAIGTLAGGIAHDFNNILMPIMGYAEIAQNRVGADSPIAADLAQVVQAAHRAKALVKQILSFSRQSAQERWPLEPHLVIKEALKLLRASLPSTIDIRPQIDSACGCILADPTQVHQIIMNLATNAYHAMRERGGVLGVSLSRVDMHEGEALVRGQILAPGDYVRIEVSDTGTGMERQTMERIFEPYFTTKPKGEGTGMGLAVVAGIVKGYGGHIGVRSEPGEGTVFEVYLPRIAEASADTQATAVDTPVRPTGTERILVVDDEPIIISMMTMLLEELGYRVSAVTDARAALALVREAREAIDLVITDMTMPGMTGLDLAAALACERPTLPVLMMTGYSDLLTREKIEAAGIRRVLMKPATVEELAQALREILPQ